MFWRSSKAQSTIAELFAAAAATFFGAATTVFVVNSTQGVGRQVASMMMMMNGMVTIMDNPLCQILGSSLDDIGHKLFEN